MSEKICGIIGTDEVYIRRLMSAMNSDEELMLRTQMFTDVQALHHYLEEHLMDVLIIDGGIDVGKISVGTVIYLTEEISSELNKIYKFQSVNSMIKQIMDLCGSANISNSGLCILGAYSPIAHIQKTLAALSLAKYYGKNYKTLYINFEEFSGFIGELPPSNYDLSDVAYMYRDNPNILEQRFSEIIVKGKYFDYIAGVECPTDISFISTWQWLEIARFIAEKCNYEYLIIDAGNLMLNPWQIIQVCQKLYMPIEDDCISQNKIKAFEKYLILIGKENLMNKIRYIDISTPQLNKDEGVISQLEGTRFYERMVQEVSGR